jgi:5'-3' exonuclease
MNNKSADKILAVDGNWVLHRLFHTQPEHSKDHSKLICQRFVSMICKDAMAVKAKRLIVSFDGDSVFRHKIFSGYKANRHKEQEDVELINNKDGLVADDSPYIYLEALFVCLAELGIPCVQISEYEADDVLCSIATQNPNVVIATRDKDAYQYLLRDDIALYDSSFKVKGVPAPRTIRRSDVERVFGVPAELCVAYQTLVGDGVDNVPRLVSAAKAAKGLKAHGGIKQWADADEEMRKHLKANLAQLKLNRKLVELKNDIRVSIPPIKWKNANPSVPTAYLQFKDFCNPKSKGLF